ncbi:hypothetical protein P6166_04625 [Stenotrophomonas sp. HITSZ_GD]|uniref:hypothetical protein n=1 Tax=Stenotrophomonas sp. HITSZ_GD TaxID=3037248 RepID=UPI00240D6B85|nr:hypothetical protein [Stenotrophomonas sp. HITSZ_GD]MDG2524642.1 hypothetical protein [Stenotrophomonas sp. HITSZ_GD]
MLIKFKNPDPRAGQTVRMDSSRGQYFIDTGSADLVKEGAVTDVQSPAPPVDGPTPGEQLVSGTAAEVIASLDAVTDVELGRAALAAEQAEAGKKRKTVVEALTARIAVLEQPQA